MTHSATFLSGMYSDSFGSSSSSNILGDGGFALSLGALFGLASFFSFCSSLLFSFPLSAWASLSSLLSSGNKEEGSVCVSSEFLNISTATGLSPRIPKMYQILGCHRHYIPQ